MVSGGFLLPSGFIKHGELGNPLGMGVSIGKSAIIIESFPFSCLINGG